MNMPVPNVALDPGPDWATNLDACLSIIDSHNHTSGQGVPITPSAIDINADLPLNGNNLTTARSLRFTPQTGTISGSADIGCLYENGVDLYYIDGAGNQVRITQGGSVTGASGTITGLPSGTASASFAGGTFTFQSATNTPAAMNFGPVTLGQAVVSGKNVTISASVSQAANYALTLPIALPSIQSAVVSDNSGNLSFLGISTSTYSPTITMSSGGSSPSIVGPFMVTRVDNMVRVSGQFSYTPSAATSIYKISLPIARTDGNFDQSYEAFGHAMTQSSAPAINLGSIGGTVGEETVTGSLVKEGGGNNLGSPVVMFEYSLVNF